MAVTAGESADPKRSPIVNDKRTIKIGGRNVTVSETVWRNSPEFQKAAQGYVDPDSRLPDRKRAQPPRALEPGKLKERSRSKRSLVVCVEIIALRHRIVDDDNIIAGSKHLRDCIAASLGVDDADKRLRWEYGFCRTEGREQTIVRISIK